MLAQLLIGYINVYSEENKIKNLKIYIEKAKDILTKRENWWKLC